MTYDLLIKRIIRGDFDGDGKKEELKESLVSSIDNQSINTLPQVEYGSLVELINIKKARLSLQSNSETIPDLLLTKKSAFGLIHIKNEGDLDLDGGDELSVVIDWADWSQVNSCIVYSFKKNRWVKYAEFPIREWQISDNPNFQGFISKNKKGFYEVATFDSEVIEIKQPLHEFLVKMP